MKAAVKYIPLKYKVLGVLLFVLFTALGVFGYFAQSLFSDDKRLYVMDLNLALLDAATSAITLEIRSRLEAVQTLIDRLSRSAAPQGELEASFFQGLPENLTGEVLGIRIYQLNDKAAPVLFKSYKNASLMRNRKLPENTLLQIDNRRPLPLSNLLERHDVQMLNRSLKLGDSKGTDLPILTFALSGRLAEGENKKIAVIVDFIQDFLIQSLKRSEIAELFIINKDGGLLSHASGDMTVEHAVTKYDHPIVERLQAKHFPKQSVELSLDGESYLCNVAEAGFNDLFVVSQIKKSVVFQALRALIIRGLIVGLLIAYVGVIISILFARKLTSNIQKLKQAADRIGQGDLDVTLDIRANDEIQSVSDSFQNMVNRVKELIQQSAQKVRMEEELKTAQLVQSTLLTSPEINSDSVKLVSHYVAASECGGDFWDAYIRGSKLTLAIGDATGHGAGAAIVTAVAKSAFSTLNSVYPVSLLPEQFLYMLNKAIYRSTRGKLLLTMCILQIDLITGEVLVGNAGHESPLFLPRVEKTGEGGKKGAGRDAFRARRAVGLCG